MTRPVRWTTRAASPFQEAAVFLESRRSGAALSFVELVETILDVASAHPELFPRVPGIEDADIRRGLVRR